jgi:hypothetical protein
MAELDEKLCVVARSECSRQHMRHPAKLAIAYRSFFGRLAKTMPIRNGPEPSSAIKLIIATRPIVLDGSGSREMG